MKEVAAGRVICAQSRSSAAAVLLTFMMVISSVVALTGNAVGPVGAGSLPDWAPVFRLHEGVPSSTSDYDWLNSSDPQDLGYIDYDGDGHMGISIKKDLPSNRWRHFWVLDPEVNEDVHVLGDVGARVWAATMDNQSGMQMKVTISDMAPGDYLLPDSWTFIGEVLVPITGPVYTNPKPYDMVITSVDHVLSQGHKLVMTISRDDSLPGNSLLVIYDSVLFDSYLTLPVQDFISITSVWAENGSGSVSDTFSDAEIVTICANVTDPFGSYDIIGAYVDVAYLSNGSVIIPPFPMDLAETDPAFPSAWKEFSAVIGPLPNGTLVVNVTGYDAQGSPTWMSTTITIVTVECFEVEAPSYVVVESDFSMTVSALDDLGLPIPDWLGTVSLQAFESDMSTPATGSLAVDSVEFTGTEGGQITIFDQSYDLGEDTIVIRATAGVASGWSQPITVISGPVHSMMIDPPENRTLQAGDPVAFEVTATDSNGHTNSTWSPNWTVTGSVGELDGEGYLVTFTASSVGEGDLTCTDDVTGVNASVHITVVPSDLARLEISPGGPISLREGQSIPLTVMGYDQWGNELVPSSPTWLTDTSGGISGTGSSVVYTAGFIPESGLIQVSAGAITDTLYVTILNALDGPWLSVIPVQISTEDSTWSLSLASYWHHVNGTSGLRWFAEGFDNSLYLVTHDSSSEAVVRFITQPDKSGSDVFRLWVRDPVGFSTYQDIEVNVQPVNDPPFFIHTPPTEFYVKFDTEYSFDYDYYVSDVDDPKDDLWMKASASDWGTISFEGLVATFLFSEKSGQESYFETLEIAVSDGPVGGTVDSSNSDYLNIVVWVTKDTPPDLNESLPPVVMYEGQTDVYAFDLDDYFFDFDGDFLVYDYGFDNIDVNITSTHEVFFSALSEWSGVTDGTFTAVDPEGAFKTGTTVVTVLPVNDEPEVNMPGWVYVRYDVLYSIDASMYVFDPDHALQELDFAFDSEYVTYVDGAIQLLFPENLSGGPFTEPYVVEVEMTVTDPGSPPLSSRVTFTVDVSSNYAPAVTCPVPYPCVFSFPEDEYLNGSLRLGTLFYDLDDSDLSYTVDHGETDHRIMVTIYPDGVVNFTAANNWSGTESVRFTAEDSYGAWASWSATVVVTPINDAPVISQISDLRLTGWPRSFRICVGQHIYDSETPFEQLVVTASPEAYVTAVGLYLYINMPSDVDEIAITLYATDADGFKSSSQTFKVTLVKTMAEMIGYPYTLPLVLLVAGVASYFAASRIPRPYSLENLFLIHNDGRLISHVTRQENMNIDKDVVSAMFTAVQEFVRDSFQQGGSGLKKLEIGDKNVFIEKGKSVYLAMIYSGWPPKDVFSSLPMLLRDIEERFENRIERWNGTMKAVKGVEQMLQSFMSSKFRPGSWQTEEDIGEEEWVDILSEEA